MPKYALYDPAIPSPSVVTGWYDTDTFTYPNLPPSTNLFLLTEDQWQARVSNTSGWAVSNNELVSYTPPSATPTAAQLAQESFNVAVAAGIAITSTSNTSLNGTYPIDAATLSRITSEQVMIAQTGKFTNGQTSRGWLDISNVPHIFTTTAEFTAFAEAIAQYEDALFTALTVGLNGGAWVAPAAPNPIP